MPTNEQKSTKRSQAAFAVEDEAYQSAATREIYDAACAAHASTCSLKPGPDVSPGSAEWDHENAVKPGERIGPYKNCRFVASGVTAAVYRHGDRALKVIVETRNMEPHSPSREAKILAQLKEDCRCIPLLDTFRDQEQRFVMVFPYMPLTLADLIEGGSLSTKQLMSIFGDVFAALEHVHGQGVVHRDVKPSAVLLASATGPAYLSDFGTAWHPSLSAAVEPGDGKVLDIGTGPYRAPEVLFGNKSYGPPVDMWAAGAMLAECCREPSRPLFESRAAHEDGSQLGLILSIFKTLGSPTRETWPEAANFRTPPFDIYQTFEPRTWESILPGVDSGLRDLVAVLVKYDTSSRATASQALRHPVFVAASPRTKPMHRVLGPP